MNKRIGIGVLVALTAALTVVSVGSGGVAKGTAKVRGPAVLPSSSCAPVFYKGAGKPQLLIASDLPLQGAGRAQTIQMASAIKFILQSRGFKAGKFTVGYQSCDDATAQRGAWDSAKCTANAQAYARDRSVVGLVGTFNSGCARLIIPILNRAPGGAVAMVSPANTAIGLTHAVVGLSDPGEPQKYYPTGKRNYVRVATSDDFQGPAGANLLRNLGKKSVYILHDNEAFGKGVALGFQAQANLVGLEVLGFEAWDGKASSYEALAAKVKQSGAEAVYLGGIVCNNGGKLVADVRAAVGDGVTLVGPDGFTPVSAVVAGAGAAAEGMYVSIAGLPREKLGPAGKKFLADFGKAEGRQIDPYAVYAAQSAVILLDAIARSNGTRNSVTAEVFKTKVTGGIMGTFGFDKNGDITAKAISFYTIKDGKDLFFAQLVRPKA